MSVELLATTEADTVSARESEGTDSSARVEVVQSVDGLERLRQVWCEWNTKPNCDIDVFMALQSHVSEFISPYVAVLSRHGSPESMLVARLERARLPWTIGYHNVFRAQVRQLTILNGGLLGVSSRRNCAALVAAVRDGLRVGDADCALFNLVDTSSTLCEAVRDSGSWWHRDHAVQVQLHRSLVVPSSVEALYQGLSAKSRKNHKWQAKKLLSDHGGDVTLRCFRSMDELSTGIAEVERIAERSYQRALGAGFGCNEAELERVRLHALHGRLRMFVLYIKGAPAAFWSGTRYGGTFFSDSMGYDVQYAKYSPGMYLVTQVLEQFAASVGEESIKEVDFGFGDAQYKAVLGNKSWQEASTYLFGPTLTGVKLASARALIGSVDRTGKRLLEKTGGIAAMKKKWRDRLRRRGTEQAV